jgi:hypothetical protein
MVRSSSGSTVAAPDAVEDDRTGRRPGPRRQWRGVGRLGDHRPLLEHPGQLLQRGAGRLVAAVEHRDVLQRVEEAAQVEQEGHQDADGQIAVHHPQRAVTEHRHGDQVADHGDQRHEDRDQPERPVVGAAVVLVELGVQLVVARLPAERLHGPHAAHGLGELDDERRDRLPGAPVGDRGVALEPAAEQVQQREAQQRDQAQRRVEHHEDDADGEHAEQGGEQAVQALVEQLGQGLDVAGQPADRLARGVPLVEGQRELLHVGEHPAAQRQQHRLPDPAGADQEPVAQPGVGQRRRHHRPGRPDQRPWIRPPARAVQQRRDRDVDADPDQERPGQPGQVLHQDHRQQHPQRPAVRAQQLSEQPPGAAAQEGAGRGGEVVVLGGHAAPAGGGVGRGGPGRRSGARRRRGAHRLPTSLRSFGFPAPPSSDPEDRSSR